MKKGLLAFLLLGNLFDLAAQAPPGLKTLVNQMADAIEPKVIEWRRDFHRYPELSNREFKTAEKVAAHLSALGMEVRTGIAYTGVVGILKGGQPGPVIGLRADMDALPVAERVELPFKSVAKSTYNGEEVDVMHACGHDTHVAIMMGVAEILAAMKNELAGTVVFVFQPAEEGPPEGEEGGAPLMIKEGVLDNPKIEAMFGLHINSQTEVGKIAYRSGGIMAASDWFYIEVHGKQTHGSQPWSGVDPIVISAEIIQGLQTIVSRQMDLTEQPAVVTVGKISSGVRANIIPELAEMIGTIRTLDTAMQRKIHQKVKLTAEKIAESAGARAEVRIENKTPVTFNDPALTARVLPSLRDAAGSDQVEEVKARTGAEDFGFFAQKVPSFYFFLGGMPRGKKREDAAAHHTPDFYIDESGMKLGVRAFCYLVLDYFGK
ncbi:MAG: amidohydrolase [Haliscomenobacteraceae bacterium CHB4]|nr:putative hydrolase YxeP [Saprospiraceae bacterium]MCE7922063.1 amidohydrolase [Haliscomenobacteraceae bacterium CHB4]